MVRMVRGHEWPFGHSQKLRLNDGNFETYFGQSRTDLGLKMVLVCLIYVCYICVLLLDI